jgi:hypothetical protein
MGGHGYGVAPDVAAPGKTFIKVSGIIYLVVGGIMSLLGVISLAAFSDAGSQMAWMFGIDEGAFLMMLLLQTANYIMCVVAGVVGVKNAGDLEKAQFCYTFGIVMAFVQGTNFIGQLTVIGFNIVDTLALVLPVLFIIGASKNRQVN